jgi:hypothetical protein
MFGVYLTRCYGQLSSLRISPKFKKLQNGAGSLKLAGSPSSYRELAIDIIHVASY